MILTEVNLASLFDLCFGKDFEGGFVIYSKQHVSASLDFSELEI